MLIELKKIVSQAVQVAETAVTLELRKPSDYQSNRLYDAWVNGRHLIVKEFLNPDEWQIAPFREFHAMRRLAPLNIAPKPVFYDPDVAPVVIYEFMEGVMWSRKRPAPASLAQLADVWLQMHTLPTEDLWPSSGHTHTLKNVEDNCRKGFQVYADWATVHFPAGLAIAEVCFRLLEQFQPAATQLAEQPPQLCFCRADPRIANVIQRPDGRLGLVDWEDSGLRDPARALADLVVHPNQEDLLDMADWQPFFQPYLQVREEVDRGIYGRFQLYTFASSMFWLALFLRVGVKRVLEGELDGWQINDLPANQRLRRYFARARAWPNLDFTDELTAVSDVHFFGTSPDANKG